MSTVTISIAIGWIYVYLFRQARKARAHSKELQRQVDGIPRAQKQNIQKRKK